MTAKSEQSPSSSSNRFAKLESAIWNQLQTTDNEEIYAQSWLVLACHFIGDIQSAVVVIGEADVGPFAPVAFWPDEPSFDNELSLAAERAMKERKGVSIPHSNGLYKNIAYPLTIDGHLLGVVAVVSTSDVQPVQTLRQLQWSAAWMETFIRRRQLDSLEEERQRTEAAFDLLASMLEHQRFKQACHAVVTELARRLDCDPVSIGFIKRGRIGVRAISHAAQFGKRMNLIRAIGSAMDEAVDQEAVILYPPDESWEHRITTEHEELCKTHQVGSVLTIPLRSNGEVFGALTFERSEDMPFDNTAVETCDAVATLVGPILDYKRQNDRSIFTKVFSATLTQLKRLIGAHYFGRKLATVLLVLVVAYFSFAKGEYRVASPALLEGEVQRAVVAPFDGFLSAQFVRPGEIILQDEVLAVLDDRDLQLERLRWITTERQRATEFDQAMAQSERAQANIAQAQREQAIAQVKLLDAQLARTKVKAPFDAVVVDGDLSQKVGGVVQRGEELYRLAPLHAYRIILEVDEGDVADIEVGQLGDLRLASLPEEKLSYQVQRIMPIAEQKDGRNFFRVEATLDEASERLRPGMEGIAKTSVDERLLIQIWTRRLVNWWRLAIWEWWP